MLRPPKTAPWPTHFGKEKNRAPEDGPSAGRVVEAVAAESGLSPAQVLLRWGLQKGLGVLPRSRPPPHIAENWRAPCDTLSPSVGARAVRLNGVASSLELTAKFFPERVIQIRIIVCTQ